MSYDNDPRMTATADALEAPEGASDESPEDGLGDGGALGKYCLLEGKYKKNCQSCTGFVCNLVKW